MKKLLYTLITTLSFILISCDLANKPAKGFEDQIIVVADSVEYEDLLPALQSTFEKEIYTPNLKNLSP